MLNNLQSRNAELISDGYSQKERLLKLNELARNQMKTLLKSRTLKNSKNQEFLK
ncbi:hypothetical protein [Staphylococcus warneri]|uniref:hypothetical protein n=1 Tax=Staphylococcus warneri TaxID=1292 RepID=UPI003F69E74C